MSANLSGHASGGHSVELSHGAQKRQQEQDSEAYSVEYGPQLVNRNFHGVPSPTCSPIGEPIRLDQNGLKNLSAYPMLCALQVAMQGLGPRAPSLSPDLDTAKRA